MKKSENQNSRRSFLKKAVLGTAAVSTAPAVLSQSYKQNLLLDSRSYGSKSFAANDHLNLALIGTGIQGIYDTTTALQVPGVKLVAACDLYAGRLDRARELWGKDIFVSRDYREIANDRVKASQTFTVLIVSLLEGVRLAAHVPPGRDVDDTQGDRGNVGVDAHPSRCPSQTAPDGQQDGQEHER